LIVDTSAVVAVLNDEPDADLMLETMRDAPLLKIAAPTAVELSLIAGAARFDHVRVFLDEASIQVADFTAEHFLLAQRAHAAFGRGSGSPARLNLGDCFSYALAKAAGEPLLFKGDDFRHTDIAPAL